MMHDRSASRLACNGFASSHEGLPSVVGLRSPASQRFSRAKAVVTDVSVTL